MPKNLVRTPYLEKQLVQPFPTQIIWVYSKWQPDYDQVRALYQQAEFIHGWHDELYVSIKPDERNLLILDYQMDEPGESNTLAKLFIKGSHHRNLTAIYLVQNVFNQARSQRTVSLNSHYNVVFRNKRDASQFRTLGYQMCPENARWLLDAFKHCTKRPYDYLILDFHPTTDEKSSVLTNVLPGEGGLTYYQERGAPINTWAARLQKRPSKHQDGKAAEQKTESE